jgi:hypothetical protein
MDKMSHKVACPRCSQDWLQRVRLVELRVLAVICPECEALWVDSVPSAQTFQDYATYMRARGRTRPDDPAELEFVENYIGAE